MMEQRSTVLDLHLKGLSGHVIHDDLVDNLGPRIVMYNTVTRYLGETKLSTAEVTLDPEPNLPHLDDSDLAILAALDERSFSSMQELSQATHIPRATVYRTFTKWFWFLRGLL
jgi:hypothetical protein